MGDHVTGFSLHAVSAGAEERWRPAQMKQRQLENCFHPLLGDFGVSVFIQASFGVEYLPLLRQPLSMINTGLCGDLYTCGDLQPRSDLPAGRSHWPGVLKGPLNRHHPGGTVSASGGRGRCYTMLIKHERDLK